MKLDVLKLIKKTRNVINPRYDMRIRDINTIYDSSADKVEAISKAFVFGYAQGVKAQKKGSAFNG